MAVCFFDSSGLVKLHVHEAGSAWVRSLTRVKAGHTLYIARFKWSVSRRITLRIPVVPLPDPLRVFFGLLHRRFSKTLDP